MNFKINLVEKQTKSQPPRMKFLFKNASQHKKKLQESVEKGSITKKSGFQCTHDTKKSNPITCIDSEKFKNKQKIMSEKSENSEKNKFKELFK